MNRSFFQLENCLSLNFDYFNTKLSIPQIATTPEDELKLTLDFPKSCIFVIVGGKYLNKIGSVMEKVDSITNDIGGTRPLAVFIISNTNKDNIDIDVDYSFDRYRSTPVMVIYLINILNNCSDEFYRFISSKTSLILMEQGSNFTVQVNIKHFLTN